MGTQSAGSKRVGGKIPKFQDNYIENVDASEQSVYFESLLAAGEVELYYLRMNSPRGEEIFRDNPDRNLDNRANRSFFTRIYKPQTVADHVAIIYNGLDETIFNPSIRREELFKFYDDLGIQLARAKILAVLVPTPYHMNRALAFIDPEIEEQRRRRESFIDYTIPTEALMERNYNIYRNHFQGFKETVELCRCLRPDPGRKAWPALASSPGALPAQAVTFLRTAVSPSVKISLLGYSLGGLRAITEYLFDRHDARAQKRETLFTACVAVNSGGALSALPNPQWVDPQRWRSMIDDLIGQRFAEDQHRARNTLKGLPTEQHKEAERYFTFLNDVFLGQATSLNVLGEVEARETAKRLLFVIGGGDNLVPLESIKRFAPKGGVTIFQVAGMGHLFPYDPAWQLWKGIVLDVIAKFLDNTARIRAAMSDYEGLARLIALLDHELQILPYRADLKNPKVVQEAKDRIGRAENVGRRVLGDLVQSVHVLADISAAELDQRFQNYTQLLVDQFHMEVRRGVAHPSLYKRQRRALFFGRFLCDGYTPLQDAWEDLERLEGERIGEVLVRMKVVRPDDLDQAVLKQNRLLGELREALAQEFANHLQTEEVRDGPVETAGRMR